MKWVFIREIRANIKSLFFWSFGMFIFSAMGFMEYSAIMNSDASMTEMVNMMPRIIKVMMGMGSFSIDSPLGYYACMFLWLSIIAFAHAILLGSSIVSKEERDKTAEFIFTKPIKRSNVITGKLLVAVINTLIITIIAWGSTFIFMHSYIKGTDLAVNVNLTMIGMFIVQVIFLFIGFMLSAISKDSKKAGIYASVVLIITYLLSVIIEMIGDIIFLNVLSPFRYFNVSDIVDNGISYIYGIISIVIIIVSGVIGYSGWNKKDLRN